MDIYKDFRFEAAHRLPSLPEGHKCARLHGHSFKIRVTVTGEINNESGWVMDFAKIKEAVDPILQIIDHSYLNEIEGLSNPTSENISIWLWEKLIPSLPGLKRISVQETLSSGCEYQGKSKPDETTHLS